MLSEQQLRTLERRLIAALCDATAWGGCWLILSRAFSRPESERSVPLWLTAAAVLLLVAATELLTGITPGKWLTGLRVRRPDSTPPLLANLLTRGALRLLPLAILLLTLPATSTAVHLIAFTTAGTIATAYLCAAYLTFIRHNLSPFDLAARTVVIRPAERS